MHKKLEAELMSLAHNILQMKNKNDAVALKEKARLLYERLSVLTFVDEYINTTPNATQSKEEIVAQIEAVEHKKIVKNQPEVAEVVEHIIEDRAETIKQKEAIDTAEVEDHVEQEELVVEQVVSKETIEVEVKEELVLQEDVIEEPKRKLTLQEELKDSVSADVTTNLFTKVEDKATKVKPSLNDKLQNNIQVGLNDRIAFVKHLFGHSQADFNRVLSQLNSFKTEKEAMNFIKNMVKPDYDWNGKEEYETRFLDLVERKFL